MKINKFWFWFLSFTWGLPMTLIGCFVALVLILTKHKPKKWLYGYYFEVGKNWGGFEMGPFFVYNNPSNEHGRNHEFGHGIQNCFFGPFTPFVISIPSAIRYWYREYLVKVKKKKYSDLPDYDSIWFEGQATKIGYEYMNWLQGKKS